MRNHWFFKLLAFVLALVSGALIVLGGMGLVLADETGYVSRRMESAMYSGMHSYAQTAASSVVGTYAMKQSGVSEQFFREYIYWDYAYPESVDYEFDYRIIDNAGRTLENSIGYSNDYVYTFDDEFAIPRGVVTRMPEMDYYPEFDEYGSYLDSEPILAVDTAGNTVTTGYKLVDSNGVEFPALAEGTYAYAYGYEGEAVYRIDYVATDRYSVEVCFTMDQVLALWEDVPSAGSLVMFFQENQKFSTICLGAGCVLAVLSIVALCAMAGKNAAGEVKPSGLNVMPLDVYALAVCGGITMATALFADLLRDCIYAAEAEVPLWIAGFCVYGACLAALVAMFCMALTAQLRQGENLWLKQTLCGRVVAWCFGGGRTVINWCIRAIRWCAGLVSKTFGMMPLIWQWLALAGGVWLFTVLMAVWSADQYTLAPMFFAVVLGLPVVLYGAYGFGKLRDAAKKMSEGHLDAKIPLEGEHLYGCFADFGNDLNTLSDVCVEAAKEQMKSERMKSELITNVSHDIKTPLTSIINYVDLLQRAESEEQRAEYLEVLDRQSQRLKKLIEDLMEMSKASSGNVAVEIVPTDVVEAVSQALGEFSDRMDAKSLRVIFRTAQPEMTANCDGKLLWRVMSNVLTNVVKYAMEGTRVYVDLMEVGGRLVLSVKNISAEPLNITAEELMERFVRGDASRNTEGNGLGLNIARGLMEVQGGSLELMVDGDLFKVVLTLQKNG